MPKKRKKKGQAAPTIQADADPTTRSLAVAPERVAVAAGRRWRVVDTRSGAVLQDNTAHEAPIRGLAFSPDGQYLLTCSDDKTACVWQTADWACAHRLKTGKKATACAFSPDSKHIFVADRYGDVLCATTLPAAAATGAAAGEAAGLPAAVEGSLLLGHLQCIVTSLTCSSSSSGTPLLVSTDKDGKVRASVLPADPTKGSYEIQSYCLGHTKFVTCSAAVPADCSKEQQQQRLVVSGSGDGTVRVWDVDSGKQLCCYVASEQPPSLAFQQQQQAAGGAPGEEQQQEEQQQQGEGDGDAADQDKAAAGSGSGDEQHDQEQEQHGQQGTTAAAAAAAGDVKQAAAADGAGGDAATSGRGKFQKRREACCAVLSVAISPDGRTIAAAIEGHQEMQLLTLDAAAGQLQLLQKLSFADVANPSGVAFDSQGQLWVVGGVLTRQTESAHVGVAAKNSGSGVWEAVSAAVLPGSARSALELRVQEEEERQQQQQEQEQDQGYYFEGIKRAVYLVDEPGQKRQRRDLRDIERLRALAAAQDQQKEQQKQEQEQQQQQQEEGSAAAAQG